MVPIAILAGGQATRLGPIAARLPKSLVDIAGEPFIAHQLRLLQRQQIKQAVLCVGHLGEAIRGFVGDGRDFGIEVLYSFDGERLLGTGGALRRALPLLGDEFMVLYGDTYLDIEYAVVLEAFSSSGAVALMTVLRNEDRWDTSNVVFDGAHILRYDKRTHTRDMHYIDYGLGVLKRDVFAQRACNEIFDLSDIYGRLATEGKLAGYEVTQRFYEIGTPAGLAATETFLRQRSQTSCN